MYTYMWVHSNRYSMLSSERAAPFNSTLSLGLVRPPHAMGDLGGAIPPREAAAAGASPPPLMPVPPTTGIPFAAGRASPPPLMPVPTTDLGFHGDSFPGSPLLGRQKIFPTCPVAVDDEERAGHVGSFLDLMRSVTAPDSVRLAWSNQLQEEGGFEGKLIAEFRDAYFSQDESISEDDGDDEYSDDEVENNLLDDEIQNQDISVGYCSGRDGNLSRNEEGSEHPDENVRSLSIADAAATKITRWGKDSPFSANESILAAVEVAMRSPTTQEQIFMPKVGQTFQSLGDAYQLYNLYSWEAGFSIRWGNNSNRANFLTEDGQKFKIMQEFRCQRAFCSGLLMTFELMDIAVRRLKQLDSLMYAHGTTIRWRHWLESNFAVHVLAGDDPSLVPSIKEQFIGDSVNYEIELCRMFVVPFQSSFNWCAYIWDMRRSKIVILDPGSTGSEPNETLSKHEKTIRELHKGFVRCITELFEGWVCNWDNWQPEIQDFGSTSHDQNEAGLCTLFLARYFDGERCVKHPTQDSLNNFKKEFLYEIMGLQGNRAAAPAAYVQAIQD